MFLKILVKVYFSKKLSAGKFIHTQMLKSAM
jgi:hypothetical protein